MCVPCVYGIIFAQYCVVLAQSSLHMVVQVHTHVHMYVHTDQVILIWRQMPNKTLQRT